MATARTDDNQAGGDDPPFGVSPADDLDVTAAGSDRQHPCAEDIEDADLEGDRPFRAGTARAALSYSAFRRVYAGSVLSNIGSWTQNVVLGSYALTLTGSASFVGLITFANLGPLLLFSLIGGSLADRFDRRKLLIIVSIEQACFAFLLAFIARDPDPSQLALVAAVFAIGMGQAVAGPTFSSVLPNLVERRDIAGAVSLTSVNMNLSRVIGAALGGALYAAIGASTVFAFNAVTYFFIIAGVATVTMPRAPAPAPGAPTGWRRILGGFKVAREDPVIGRVLITVAAFSFCSLVFIVDMAVLAEHNLGIPAKSSTYGALYATFGFGALLGALAVGTFLAGRNLARIVKVALLGFAVFLAVWALLRQPTPAFPVAFVTGFFYFLVITSLSTVLQSRVDDAARGRVMAIWIMAFGGTVPIGGMVAGPIIDATSMTVVMLFGAAVAVGLAFFARVSDAPVRIFRAS